MFFAHLQPVQATLTLKRLKMPTSFSRAKCNVIDPFSL